MGKSNNLYNQYKDFYQKDSNLDSYLTENEIQIFENINHYFLNNFIKDFSHFIKNDIQLISYDMKIGSYNYKKNTIQSCTYLNLIEISPDKYKSFIVFSNNFLSLIIELLFGGRSHFSNIINKQDMNSTEMFINKKILNFIVSIFSATYTKYFSAPINFIDKQKYVECKDIYFHSRKMFLINNFNFKIDNIEVFFSFLIPLSMIKKIKNNINITVKTQNKNIIELDDIHHIKLNVSAKIINLSISYDTLSKLSVGDILSIKKPNNIVLYVENKPVFFAKYKRFNEQSIVFVKEFINNNLESNQDKEYSSE